MKYSRIFLLVFILVAFSSLSAQTWSTKDLGEWAGYGRFQWYVFLSYGGDIW